MIWTKDAPSTMLRKSEWEITSSKASWGDISSLRLHAGAHRRLHGFFRLLCSRFPFAAYYEIAPKGVIVVAILDMRRNPSWIQQSLGRRR